MRTITSKAIAAFKSAKNFKSGATQVNQVIGGVELILHGNTIARNIDGEGLSINLCGWNTPTTRDRLNGLPNVRVNTKQGQAFLNGQPIPSIGWIKVSA
jgi:hypothetical protein